MGKKFSRLPEREIADRAIKTGKVTIDGVDYSIEKHSKGWCDGCAFRPVFLETHHCPSLAMKICLRDGLIMKKIEK